MERSKVFELINGERAYQDIRWKPSTIGDEGLHTPEEWFMYIEDYVNEAKHVLSRQPRQVANSIAMDIMRKVGAMAVAAMEQIETPARKYRGEEMNAFINTLDTPLKVS